MNRETTTGHRRLGSLCLTALLAATAAIGIPTAGAEKAPWPERTLLHEQLPSYQAVSGSSLYAMVSQTNTPERGPYRLVRTNLTNGTNTRGPLFKLPTLAVVAGRLWITGSEHGLPLAVEVDPRSLHVIRTIHFTQGYGAFPLVDVAPGPSDSVWLGAERTLIRVAAASGQTLARTTVPTGFVIAGVVTDPDRAHLYVSLARKVHGGLAGGALVEDNAASGAQLASASSPLLSGSVAGSGLTAVPGGVWASFRTGMLGLTIHLRQRDLAQVAPPGPKIASTPANGLFHWPMSASTLYAAGSLWLTNESGVLACLDPVTGRVRARERISPQEVLDLLAVGPTGHHLIALDNATTLIQVTPPASCWAGS